jgi:hypothetical protein
MAEKSRIERREAYEKASRELRKLFSDVSGSSIEIDRIVTCGDGTVLLKGPAGMLRVQRKSQRHSSACFCDDSAIDLAGGEDTLHIVHVGEISTDLFESIAF